MNQNLLYSLRSVGVIGKRYILHQLKSCITLKYKARMAGQIEDCNEIGNANSNRQKIPKKRVNYMG